MNGKVTLKQIAEQAGVSLATVHRVLNGKGGCGEERKAKILAIAKEQGYTVNSVTANVRRPTIHIALVFPKHHTESRFFLQRILDGYLKCRSESMFANIVFQEYYYNPNDGSAQSMGHYLRQIYLERPVRYDGVAVYGLGVDEESRTMLNRLVGSRIPIIMLERLPAGLEDVCSVQVNDSMAGNMAGDMLVRFIHGTGTIALICQGLEDGDANGAACAQCVQEFRPDLKLHTVSLVPGEGSQADLLREKLSGIDDLVGVYITCARHTRSFLEIRGEYSSLQAVIGSELFSESYQALHTGALDAVIDKRPEQIGHQALSLLIGNLEKNEDLPQMRRVTPRVILRANSDVFYQQEEDPYGNCNETEPPICQQC